MENVAPICILGSILNNYSRTYARKPFRKPMGSHSHPIRYRAYYIIAVGGSTIHFILSPKTFAKTDIVRYNTPMNALPTTLQRMAHTKLFIAFAMAFFFLISISLVILLSSLSVTPSFENLESLIRGNQVVDNAQQTVLGESTTTPYSNIDMKIAVAIQKAQKDKPAFVMKQEEVEAFMVFLTGKMNLDEVHSAKLIKEINLQLEHMDADFIRISIIDPRTLNQVVPSTNKNRLFFFIEGVSQLSTPKVPTLAPVAQNTPLELGVIVLN